MPTRFLRSQMAARQDGVTTRCIGNALEGGRRCSTRAIATEHDISYDAAGDDRVGVPEILHE